MVYLKNAFIFVALAIPLLSACDWSAETRPVDPTAPPPVTQAKPIVHDKNLGEAGLPKTPVTQVKPIVHAKNLGEAGLPKIPIGIKNTGNSCYANSTMQLLMMLPSEFFTAAREKFIEDPLSVSKGLISQEELLFLQRVLAFRDSWISGHATPQSNGDRLRDIINTGIDNGIYTDFGRGLISNFKYTQQEDADEFFKKIYAFLGTGYDDFQVVSHQVDKNGDMRIDGAREATDSLGNLLSMALTNFSDGALLQELIEGDFSEEEKNELVLEGEVSIYNRLLGDVDHLIVQLKRFDGQDNKIETQVDLADGVIDLTPFMEELPAEEQKYEFEALVLHHGPKIKGGHFTARVKYGDQWYIANDSTITKTTWDEIKEDAKDKVYLMLFKKVTA